LSALSPLLTCYYELKEALINSDASAASAKALILLKAIMAVDMQTLTASEHSVFQSLQDKLSYNARHISEVQKIAHQREHFANLSVDMFTLAKATRLSAQPVYQAYCPMNKSYWLSKEAAIRNPYFGNGMPSCGKVSATIPQQ
jgi:hypothetical protein